MRTRPLLRIARKAQRGLTLLEIMIVIAILGLLVVIVVPRVMGAFSKSKSDLAKIQVDKWKGYYTTWELARNKGEKACTDVKLFDDIAKFTDKETQVEELNDPWGKTMQISCEDSGVRGIYSFGENGKDEKGDGDDVASWKKPKN